MKSHVLRKNLLKSVDSQSVRSSPPHSQFSQCRLFSAFLQVVHGPSVDTYQNYNILFILYNLHHDKSRRERGKWIARVTFRSWYISGRFYRSGRLGVNLSAIEKSFFLKEHIWVDHEDLNAVLLKCWIEQHDVILICSPAIGCNDDL
jgi:hypothetical protein